MKTIIQRQLVRGAARFLAVACCGCLLLPHALRAEIFVIADGDVSGLIAALDAARDGDTIELARNGVYTLVETHNITSGANGLPVIDNEIAIHGNGATIQRDTGAPAFRIFHFRDVGPGTTVRDLTIRHGSTLAPGGGSGAGMYLFNGSPTISRCVFSMNRAELTGGGMVNVFNSSPTLTDCLFETNFAGARGGGMANLTNTAPTIVGSTFRNNITHGEGGGVYNFQSSSSFADGTFKDNIARHGGGMFNNNSSPTLATAVFAGNWAEFGAGMHNRNNSRPTVADSSFENNRGRWGGGMFNQASGPRVTGTVFSGNRIRDNDSGDGGGAGMANTAGSHPTLTGCTFYRNDADAGTGGGMYNENSSPTLNACVFDRNWANPDGGGIYNTANSHPTLTDGFFDRNGASNSGGAIHNTDSRPLLTNLTFTANSANDRGGAILNSGSAPDIADCTFAENSADHGGAVANLSRSDPTIRTSVFHKNRATWEGGAVYNNNSDPTIARSRFFENEALLGNGGGVANVEGSHPAITGAVFEKNAANLGGGIFNDAVAAGAIGSSTFCENRPGAITGPWNDLGDNTFNALCGGPPEKTYEHWVREHFEPSVWEEQTVTGPSATPFGDGVPNLLKYALGFDPEEIPPTLLPVPQVQTVASGGEARFLTFSFAHPSDLADVAYQVQVSHNLVDWSENALLINTVEREGATIRTYRDAVPIDASTRRFMRLQVKRP